MFVSLSTDGHLGGFYLSAIVNNISLNIYVQVFVWTNVVISLGYVLGGGIPLLYGNSMFNHLRRLQSYLQVGCIMLYSHQKYVSFRFPHILVNIYCYLDFKFQLTQKLLISMLHCFKINKIMFNIFQKKIMRMRTSFGIKEIQDNC